jgi:diaminopimelate decarboxylase
MIVERGGPVTAAKVAEAAALVGTPLYLYDEATILGRCAELLAMPNAFGLHVAYAMKANSSRAILELVSAAGLGIDASSLNEVRRAVLAGIPPSRIMLTTQEVPTGADRAELERLMTEGSAMTPFAAPAEQWGLRRRPRGSRSLVRVNPWRGAGESVTRNTGDKYSSSGTPPGPRAARLPSARAPAGLAHRTTSTSTSDRAGSQSWRATTIGCTRSRSGPTPRHERSISGRFKEARMPDERPADVRALGLPRQRSRRFALALAAGMRWWWSRGPTWSRRGRPRHPPDRSKSSGPNGFEFDVCDGGIESSTRPLL